MYEEKLHFNDVKITMKSLDFFLFPLTDSSVDYGGKKKYRHKKKITGLDP